MQNENWEPGTYVQITLTARIQEKTEKGYKVLIYGLRGENGLVTTDFEVRFDDIIGATLQIDDLVAFQQYLHERNWLVTNHEQFLAAKAHEYTEEELQEAEENMRDVARYFYNDRLVEVRKNHQ